MWIYATRAGSKPRPRSLCGDLFAASAHLLEGVAHRPVEQRHEGLRLAHPLERELQQPPVEQLALRHAPFEQELLEAQQLVVGAARREALRRAAQRVVAAERECVGLADGPLDLGAVVENLVAHRAQHHRLGAVEPHGQHVSVGRAFAGVGLHMEVVAGIARLLAARGDVGADVLLVGPLVGAEARVARNAVGAVLHAQPAHGGVE